MVAGGGGMSLIFIKCARTGCAVSTGIEIEREAFGALPNVHAETKCPACGGSHIWTPRDAWLSDESGDYEKS